MPVSMPKTPDVGDRDGAVGHRGGVRLAGARRAGELAELDGEVVQAEPVRVLDVRHDEPARRRGRDPEVDVVLVDDLLRLRRPRRR